MTTPTHPTHVISKTLVAFSTEMCHDSMKLIEHFLCFNIQHYLGSVVYVNRSLNQLLKISLIHSSQVIHKQLQTYLKSTMQRKK